MKTIISKKMRSALRLSGMAAIAMLASGQTMAQNTPSVKTSAKANRFFAGVRASHLYDVKFKPNIMLDNGFEAEDMQGLNGRNTKFDMAFGIEAGYFFGPLFSMDVAYDKGKMTGAGKFEYYESDVDFISIGANLSLKRSVRTKPYRFVPYLRGSIARAGYNTERKFKEDNVTFNSTSGNCLQIGAGLGMRYHISNNFHINLMSEFVTSYTDAWDGYDYSNGNDHLVKTTLAVRYTFGKNNHVDRTLAWQDKRVDELLAANGSIPANAGNSNNNGLNSDAVAKLVQALSDSMQVMRGSMARMQAELQNKATVNNVEPRNTETVKSTDIKVPEQETVKVLTANPANSAVITETQSQRINLEQVKKMLLIEMNTVRFAAGRAILDEESKTMLNRIAVIMQSNPGFKLQITGHTDIEGSGKNNMRLSEFRASAVATYLERSGVPKQQLEIKGMGHNEPVDKRRDKNANANNRRVEFKIKSPDQ